LFVVCFVFEIFQQRPKCFSHIFRWVLLDGCVRKEFCAEIKSLQLDPSDILVSYDVKDLFTNIPTDVTLNTLEKLLDRDPTLAQRTSLKTFHITKLVSFCMKEANYFRFQELFYMQKRGAPMGSPLSPVLAEVFMEFLEDVAFSTADTSITPTVFKRIFPNHISFTIEKEENGRLSFLDALVIRDECGLKTTVYRKPTHSNRYLHFSTSHSRWVMRGIITGMVDRAISVCDKEFLAAELRHIKATFLYNGYPPGLISSVVRQRINRPDVPLPEHNGPSCPLLVLPYYKGIGEKIRRMGKEVGFKTYFKSSSTLRAMLRNDKRRLPPEDKPGVLCSCSASYIGETGNSLSQRFSQHLSGLKHYKNALSNLQGKEIKRRGRPGKTQPQAAMDEAVKASAIVEHASHCDGQPVPQVICHEEDFQLRKIKEALFIRHNEVINRDKGKEVSDICTNLIARQQLCKTTN
ncbi:hypothetical protein M514_10612, partial [Trichuris suis]